MRVKQIKWHLPTMMSSLPISTYNINEYLNHSATEGPNAPGFRSIRNGAYLFE
jgi:hypothetical protein